MILPKLKENTEQVIEKFLAEKLRKTGAKGFVLGLSGGIDSAVVMRLASRAVGPDKVLAIMMPEADSDPTDLEDAKTMAELDKVRAKVVPITPAVAAFKEMLGGKADRLAMANIKARCRMIVLYQHAAAEGRLVLGTGNKTELLVGYFTKHGDGAADLEPIGDLYKTEVRELAKGMGIPERICAKAPSAGLWKGQTDEGELGITYERLDAILHGIEMGFPEDAIAKRADTTVDEVERISEKIRLTSHKRKFPPAAKIGLRTPGLDWREGDEDV